MRTSESSSPLRVRRALLSVTDKAGVVELAKGLARLGVEILSTGGTAQLLERGGVPVVPLERFTASPEMLDGRVKTLHPRIHGGILARRDLESHRREVEARGLDYIDLVAVNLYDFEGAAARSGASFDEILEHIDIGGPTLLRAAAKNHRFVIPLVDPKDYAGVLESLKETGDVPPSERLELAKKVYATTSRYDRAVSEHLERRSAADNGRTEDPRPPHGARARSSEQRFASGTEPASAGGLPAEIALGLTRVRGLRYGENPHQEAAFYRESDRPPELLAKAEQLQGKELSFNNLLDLDSALGLVLDLGGTTAVFIKHNNPCGAARGATIAAAIEAARACDPVSAFGAVVAVSQKVDRQAAEALTESFVEAIIAPGYTADALQALSRKNALRALSLDPFGPFEPQSASNVGSKDLDLRQIRGGFLVQTKDRARRLLDEIDGGQVVTRRAPTHDEREALGFAWAVAKHVRSNAIVFSKKDRIAAVGAGQMSRVDSVKLCVMKGGEALQGTVVASDAFFPFRDGVDVLAEAGARAIVQPGGSIRDEEVIRAADEHEVAMIFTGVRHFRH